MLKEAISPAGVNLRGLRIGVPRKFFFEEADPAVLSVIEEALARLRAAGAELVDEGFDVPDMEATLHSIFAPIERFEAPRQLGASCVVVELVSC
jgi:Asp-tRNA(Asn)/Glu-tRNA(Gln) amidotransferase A subunit family amidase